VRRLSEVRAATKKLQRAKAELRWFRRRRGRKSSGAREVTRTENRPAKIKLAWDEAVRVDDGGAGQRRGTATRVAVTMHVTEASSGDALS
jgi:hypothetical protein